MKRTFYAYDLHEKEPFEIFEVSDDNKTVVLIRSSGDVIYTDYGNMPEFDFLVHWLKEDIGTKKNEDTFTLEDGDRRKVFLEKASLNRGEYYPRIFRPIYNHFKRFPRGRVFLELDELMDVEKLIDRDLQKIILINIVQLDTYINLLKKIFLSVFPSQKNFNTFGHEIRNLIILCATEAEAQMKGILKSNRYKSSGSLYNTKDYVKLASLLKLEDYSIRLRYFPDIPPIRPFENWSPSAPTKSLEWYSNYNSIKHDRENSFEKSTLSTALQAISACIILSVSQFGASPFQEIVGSYFERVRLHFDVMLIFMETKAIIDEKRNQARTRRKLYAEC